MSAQSPEEYSASVATTLAISVEQLRRRTPRAVDLLNLCAFLAPEPIPRSVLTEHRAALPATLGRAVGSSRELNRMIGALRGYNLAEVTGGDLVLHRSVQAAARDSLTPAGRRRWTKAAVSLMRVAFPYCGERSFDLGTFGRAAFACNGSSRSCSANRSGRQIGKAAT
jgi:hypothetical protein